MKWKPIDTAPKDGTWVLAFPKPSAHKSPPVVVRWEEHDSHRYGNKITLKGWATVSSSEPSIGNLTHWMPLPPAPEDV